MQCGMAPTAILAPNLEQQRSQKAASRKGHCCSRTVAPSTAPLSAASAEMRLQRMQTQPRATLIGKVLPCRILRAKYSSF